MILCSNPGVVVAPEALANDADRLEALLKLERAKAADLTVRNAALEAKVTRLAVQAERYEHIIAMLKRLTFGKQSEKLDKDQLELAFEDLEQAAAQIEAEGEKADPQLKQTRARERRKSRSSLPEHLVQVDVTIEPRTTACPCCAGAMHQIGEDVSRRLDVIPAVYQVIVTHRPKYACRACEGKVVQAPAPARLIEGGLPTERLVAQVLVAKYADHMPLYRQSQGLARQGIDIHRATLAFWVGYAAAELEPLWRHMRDRLLMGDLLFVDETRAPVLDPGRGRTKTGYFWTIARDGRPWNGQDPPAVVYTYAPGRGADHAVRLLKDFGGVLHTDGYAAYQSLTNARNDITLAHCWAHVRRKFFDLAQGGGAPVAKQALVRIAALYAVEAQVRGQDHQARLAARRQHSAPLVDRLKTFLEGALAQARGGSPLAKAIRYALSRWVGLTRFLSDGRIELDTNPVERAMRPIALNRKNALFAGSDEGAHHWAIIATMIECCKLHGLNPQAWLEDVLTRLVNGHPQSQINQLTPWAWKTGAQKN